MARIIGDDLEVTGATDLDGTLNVDGATTHVGTTALGGDITIADTKNIILNATTGTRIGTATTQKLAFWNAAPIARPSAYTQTYATAAKTVPNATAVNPPAGGTGTAAGGYDTAANRNLMITSLTNLIADVDALKKVVNAIIDDLQAAGIFG